MISFFKTPHPCNSTGAKSAFLIIIALLFSAWILGQAFRDSSELTALCFYFPSPVAALVFFAAAGFSWYHLAKRLAALALLAALPPLVFTLGVENQWVKKTDEPATMAECRLVHWNISSDNLETGKIIATLKKYNADIYVLSEVSKYLKATSIAAGLGDEFTTLRLGELAVIAKDRLVAGRQIANGKAKAYPLAWNYGGIETKLLVVDLPSDIFIDRAPLLAWIRNLTVTMEPDIIVGDFNTPRRASGFGCFPEGYAHAYDLAGKGWSYTWPTPLPMYAIDQCIVGPKIHASDYQIHTTSSSDHCLQVLSFTR